MRVILVDDHGGYAAWNAGYIPGVVRLIEFSETPAIGRRN